MAFGPLFFYFILVIMNDQHTKIVQILSKEFSIPPAKVNGMILSIMKALRSLINLYPKSIIIKDFGGFHDTKITDKFRLREIIRIRKQNNDKQKRYFKKKPEKNNVKRFANNK